MSHLSVFMIFWKAFSSFFHYKWGIKWWVSKKNPLYYSCEIGPSRSPFGITRQASWCQSVILGRVFPTHPYTHDIFLYSLRDTIRRSNSLDLDQVGRLMLARSINRRQKLSRAGKGLVKQTHAAGYSFTSLLLISNFNTRILFPVL